MKISPSPSLTSGLVVPVGQWHAAVAWHQRTGY